MSEFWETAFSNNQLMWGEDATLSSQFVADYFKEHKLREILIPGIGYGRNAKPFLAYNMNITGIEISKSAIDYARKN